MNTVSLQNYTDDEYPDTFVSKPWVNDAFNFDFSCSKEVSCPHFKGLTNELPAKHDSKGSCILNNPLCVFCKPG